MSQIRTELEQIGAWLELQKKAKHQEVKAVEPLEKAQTLRDMFHKKYVNIEKVKHQGAQVVEQVEKVRSLKDMLKNRKTAL